MVLLETARLAILTLPWAVPAPSQAVRVESCAPQGPFRELTVEQALEAAQREAKPALIVFLESGSGPCDAYDRFVFADEQAAAWIHRHLVAVRRVDDEANAARFEVPRAPALIFTTSDGVELDRIQRFLEPGPFVEEAQAVLEGRSSVGLARQAVEQAPDDPRARLELAEALLKRGRHQVALESFLWVFDRTGEDPAWEERRQWEVLGRIVFLQRSLPAAAAALTERRDRAAATLLEPGAEPVPQAELLRSARDVLALNQALRQIRDTLRVWDSLRRNPDIPAPVLTMLLDTNTQLLLLEDGRHADLLEGLGDPLVALQEELDRLKVAEARTDAGQAQRGAVARQRVQALASAGRYYRALLGSGREADAAALAELLLGLEPGYGSYEALIGAAAAMERLELGRALVERGLEALPQGPERQRLRRYSRRVLREDG